MSTTPRVVLIPGPDGRLTGPDGDPWLTPGQLAAELGVTPETVSRWAAEHGPDHAHPYPAHVPGQHVLVGNLRATSLAAVRAWRRQVYGVHLPGPRGGRVRVRPEGLTASSWEALQLAGRGEVVVGYMQRLALSRRGLVTHGGGITDAGRALLKEWGVLA